MKNEYVIENALLDAISEISAEWIEQAADYEVTRKIIPFPYKYAVMAANLFLCVICAVAFSLTKLNRNTDPRDFEQIFGTNTEEPEIIISETKEPVFETEKPVKTDEPELKTEKPEKTEEPESSTKTERPEDTKKPGVTHDPNSPAETVKPSDNVVMPDDNTDRRPITPTKAPLYATMAPTNKPTAKPPMIRVELPKRQVIEALYENASKTEDDFVTQSPTAEPVATAFPNQNVAKPTAGPVAKPEGTENPYFGTESPEPAPPNESSEPVASISPTKEPILGGEVLDKKYWFTWLNKFYFGNTNYVFDSMMYKGYEVFFATDESNIAGSIDKVEIYNPDNPAQKVPGVVYELKGISPDYAVAVRYDGYEDYIIAVRVDYNPDTLLRNKLQKMLDFWL